MNYEIKPADEKGFTLFYRGIEIGTAKLHCDAVLVAKRLDKEFELEYHRGCQTLERMLERQRQEIEFQDTINRVRAEQSRQEIEARQNRCLTHGQELPCTNCDQ